MTERVWHGTILGIAAATLALGLFMGGFWGLVTAPFLFIWLTCVATPGAILLGFPLAAAIGQLEQSGTKGGSLVFQSMIVGAPFGFVNLLIIDALLFRALSVPELRLASIVPAIAGGMGMGLGIALCPRSPKKEVAVS